MLRPAVRAAADCGLALLGAAAGCLVMVDERLDLPPGLGAVALAPKLPAWAKALTVATGALADTLARGAALRTAALALPSLEAAPPPWAPVAPVKIGAPAALPAAAE